jgi:hypothetical protein
LILRKEPKLTPTPSPPTLLVMNLGFIDTTLRRSSNHLIGRCQIHHDTRKNDEFETICSFDIEDIVHKEYLQLGRTVNGISIAIF